MTLLRQGGWTRWPTEVPSNPKHSVILCDSMWEYLTSGNMLAVKWHHMSCAILKDIKQLTLKEDWVHGSREERRSLEWHSTSVKARCTFSRPDSNSTCIPALGVEQHQRDVYKKYNWSFLGIINQHYYHSFHMYPCAVWGKLSSSLHGKVVQWLSTCKLYQISCNASYKQSTSTFFLTA